MQPVQVQSYTIIVLSEIGEKSPSLVQTFLFESNKQ